jgi:hypothetical protein
MKFISGVAAPKKPQRTKSGKGDAPARRGSPWHAVSIVTKNPSCEAARALRAKRFLSASAPRLPLPECTVRNYCACAYRHHEDRRGPPRRKDEAAGLKRGGKVAQERRMRASRRDTD